MNQTTTSSARLSRSPLNRVTALIALLGYCLASQADQSQRLNAALEERDQGRAFNALTMLDALLSETPNSSRLKVEAALIRIQLRDYQTADRILTGVLSDDTLPAKVRVNVQLLQLKARRLHSQQQNNALRLYGKIGTTFSEGQDQIQPLFDGLIGASHQIPLPAANLHGYPLFSQWFQQIQFELVHYPEPDLSYLSAHLSTGLAWEILDLRLVPAVELELTEAGAEPGLNLTAGWQATSALSLHGYLSREWQFNNSIEYQGKTGVNLFNNRPLGLSFDYRYRIEEAENVSTTFQGVGSQLSYSTTGRWTLGTTRKLEGPAEEPRATYYVNVGYPLPHGFGLVAETGYQEYDNKGSNKESAGYGRLGLTWQK